MIDGIPKAFQKKCKCCECFDWVCMCTFVGKAGLNKLECIANHSKKITNGKII